jgi:hypothetical protein
MALTPYIKTIEIIRALDDEPNDVGGLTADQLKAKFDQFADEFVEYFNETHIPEVENAIPDIPELPETMMKTDEPQTMTAVLKAKTGDDYTVAQTRNIILSPNEADGDLMENGEIWIQYEDEE